MISLPSSTNTIETINTSKRKRETNPSYVKIRKYSSDYLKYGFVSTLIDNKERPKCVICNEILSNDRMRPTKLNRHLRSKHSDCVKKPVEFFQRRFEEQIKQVQTIHTYCKQNQKLLQASFEVAILIAKDEKAHTIGESLVLPAAIRICQIVHNNKILK